MLICRSILLPCLLIAITANWVHSDEPADVTTARPVALRRTGEGDRTSGERQREGTRLTDVNGRFELAGDRVMFYPAAGRESYRLLENLALERVGQVLSESRSKQEWTISGTLTEFRGANYLLLTKAVIKAGSP
jgi:hypothetical protein